MIASVFETSTLHLDLPTSPRHERRANHLATSVPATGSHSGKLGAYHAVLGECSVWVAASRRLKRQRIPPGKRRSGKVADSGKHLALCGKELTVAPLPLLSTQTSWILSEQE